MVGRTQGRGREGGVIEEVRSGGQGTQEERQVARAGGVYQSGFSRETESVGSVCVYSTHISCLRVCVYIYTDTHTGFISRNCLPRLWGPALFAVGQLAGRKLRQELMLQFESSISSSSGNPQLCF